MLSLDDFKYSDEYKPLLPYIDIIKIDFLAMSLREIEEEVRILRGNTECFCWLRKLKQGKCLKKAQKLGFNYFQGFFFQQASDHNGKK
jgi:EAL and modified HD-GYP domain-containing signal transduction protein